MVFKKAVSSTLGIVSPHEIISFLEDYHREADKILEKFDHDRFRIFPSYLTNAYQIRVIVSTTKGVAVKYEIPSETRNYISETTSQPIEDATLTRISAASNKCLFKNQGNNNVLENLNLLTKDFYEAKREIIDALSKAANLVMENPGRFVELEAGDLRLINVGLGLMKDGRALVSNIPHAWLFASNGRTSFDRQEARSYATEHCSFFIVAAARNLPIARIEHLLDEYKTLLSKPGVNEEEVQKFLKRNFLLLSMNARRVWDKHPLGAEFQVDFVLEEVDGSYTLVEIEDPSFRLFTKVGQPTSELTHAITQVRDYRKWIESHHDYAQEGLPGLRSRPRGIVIIGRDGSLIAEDSQRLHDLNEEGRGFYEVMTYDGLMERVETLILNLSQV